MPWCQSRHAVCRMIQIPITLADVTPDWLTDALKPSGRLTGARIRSCTIEQIGAEFGFASQVARVCPEYESPDASGPRSVIVKLAAGPENPTPADRLRHKYDREARFYREIGPAVGIRIPVCYFAAYQDAPPRVVLLLEDLGYSSFGDAQFGCSHQESLAAVDRLAALHAAWWNSDKFDLYDWLASFGDFAVQLGRIAEPRGPFLSRHGEVMPERLRELTARLGPQHERLLARLSGPPQTLTHVDAHLHNFVFVEVDGR